MAIDKDKLETQKQWDTDPCGAETVGGIERGSLEFYRAIRKHRYESYAPWMPAAMGWQEWRNKDALEIGVGLGSDHYQLASAGARMTALDLSAEHLRNTERHLSLENLATQPHLGDAEAAPFPDGSFDLVYSFGVLHHTPDTQRSIDEVHRMLRPGGTALIGLYHRASLFYWIGTILKRGILLGGLVTKGRRRLMSEIEYRGADNDAVPLVKAYTRGEVQTMFRAFERVSITTHHVEPSHLLPPFSWAAANLERDKLERKLGRWGWYLIVRAQKGA